MICSSSCAMRPLVRRSRFKVLARLIFMQRLHGLGHQRVKRHTRMAEPVTIHDHHGVGGDAVVELVAQLLDAGGGLINAQAAQVIGCLGANAQCFNNAVVLVAGSCGFAHYSASFAATLLRSRVMPSRYFATALRGYR